ncbi:MAG: alanine--tRNA ligase, partial [Terriglobales bacterium]
RGYVLRKIVRRALRHGRALGLETAFLYQLAGTVADVMAPAYPELNDSRDRVARVLRAEEERFAHTLALALKELDRTLEKNATALSGPDAFKLYDTFGLPLDLLQEIANERGFALDQAGFESEMAQQRERARRSWKGGEQASVQSVYLELAAQGKTSFDGYQTTVSPDSTLRALLQDGRPVGSAEPGRTYEAVLDHTPFYAASGGQIGDRGLWTTAQGLAAEVLDTLAPVAGLIVHRIRARQPLQVGDRMEADVDVARRDATRRNHTATHLLHAALRQVLGTHVKQAGSVVEPARLRFDFTHYAPLSPEQLEEIERLVNAEILKNAPVTTTVMPLDQALSTGAMALFGEKYQENVRVVAVPGFSQELCGGTHCRATGDIGLFRIVYESSVAAGVRRIEAVTGEGAYERLQTASQRLHHLAALLHAPEVDLLASAERLLDQVKQAQADNQRLKLHAEQGLSGSSARQQREVQGIQVVTSRVDALERSQMRTLADELRHKLGSGVVAVGGAHDGKLALIIAVTPDLTPRLSASAILKGLEGVKGGGRPELAEAGGPDPSQLDRLLDQVFHAVESNWQLATGN